jgi:DNA-binding NarL/FixJ family response regulator
MAVFQSGWSGATGRQLPSVLIVSDVLLCREGVAAGLTRAGTLLVGGLASVAEAESAIASIDPDAVLLDVSMPAARPVAARLHDCAPGRPIVGFGLGDDVADALACAEAGLVGFVGREGTIEDLAAAVAAALAGEVRCSPRITAMLCDRVAKLARASIEPASPLTLREREVADLVCDGLSNKQIALRLGIGPATVKNHVHSILDKLNVARRGAIGRGLSLDSRHTVAVA